MKTRWKVLLGAVVVLAAVRAALPSIVKSRINASLSRVEGWDARVGDVDLALLRGGLVLRDIKAEGKGSSVKASVSRAAINVSWSQMLRRRLVASVDISRPRASMTVHRADKEKAKAASRKIEKKAEVVFPNLKDLFPFRIDRFAVRDGEFAVTEGELTARVTGAYFVVKGLTNIGKEARATGEAGAVISKDGTVRLDFHVDPTARPPAFDFSLAVKKIELAALNPLLRAEFGMDVDKGVFELVAEATSTGGGFHGYVKSFFADLKMGPTGGKPGGAVKVIKEAVVGAVAAVLKNQKTDAVAGKVPFEGRYDDPDIGVWEALASVLHNAFIKALRPTFEGLRR
ncbi:MAG: DUF748 domain-containing protein [Elusimicrobia bacterium]|nr:DUF748 domain-containing protein [Elusimicrobiota bacterium]